MRLIDLTWPLVAMVKLLCTVLWFLTQGATGWGRLMFQGRVYESLRFTKVGYRYPSGMYGFDWVFLDEKVLNSMYLSCCPKAHQTYLTAYFQCFPFFFPLVLLCHFQQQVLQCYCSAVGTDNGECGALWAHPCAFLLHTLCVFKHITVSLFAAPC